MKKKPTLQRITLILSLCSLIIIAIIIFTIIKITAADRSLASIYNDRILPLKQLKIVSDGYTNDYLLNIQRFNNNVISRNAVLNNFNDISKTINKNWQEYLATYLTPDEKVQIKKTEIAKRNADSIITKIKINIASEQGNDRDKLFNINVQAEYINNIEPLIKAINGLILIQVNEAEKLKITIKNVFRQIKLLSILLLFLCLFIVWFFIYRRRLENIIIIQTEELATKNNELKTTNEKLLTNIEELDVTNEELVTTNEELSVVNEQLNEYKNDLEHIVEKRTQDLYKSEIRFKGIFNNAYDAIIILKDGLFVDCNARTLEMFECSRTEFIGKSPADFSPDEQVTGKLSKNWAVELMTQAEEGNIQVFEWRNIKYMSKKKFDVEVSLNKLELNGEIFIQAIVRDITERKKTELKLIELQANLSAVLESTNDMIWALDAKDFKLIMYNSALEKYYFSRGIILKLGMTQEELMPPPLDNVWIEYYKTAISEGSFKTEQKTLVNNQILIVSIYPMKSEGKVFGVSVFARNITEIKQAEEQMRILKHSIDIATDSAYWLDSTGHFIYVNETGYKRLGYSKDELLNLVIEDISPSITPERWAIILQQLRENGNYFSESVHRRKDGTLFAVEIATSYINFNGKEYINGFAKDITERKKAENALSESEERFRVTFEKAGIGIAIVDSSGKPVKSNLKLQEMTGYSQEELLSMSFVEFTHKEDVNTDWDLYSELIQGKIDSYQIEKRYIRKDGTILWGNLTVSLVHFTNQKANYAIGMVEDITHRKDTERIILKNVIDTEEKERMNFSQELHDGLGPLISAIKMYVQLFSMPDVKMDSNEIILKAENLIDEASNTVREISFKLSPHILQNYGIIDALNAYIIKVKESKKIEINLKSIKICRFTEIIETIVYRLLCECINNTIKHAKASKIDIQLDCKINLLEIYYADNGIGFDLEQVLNSHKGIGLLNMQSRIKALGGTMIIESKPNLGVTINFQVKT